MTDLDNESLLQRRWRLRPGWEKVQIFEHLLRNEFSGQLEQISDRQLQAMAEFSFRTNPFYRRQWRQLGVRPGDIQCAGDLSLLPMLGRLDVQENAADLLSTALPRGHANIGESKTSSTSGQPIIIAQTNYSTQFFGFLKQREYRWFRYDPQGLFAWIRHPRNLAKDESGKMLANGVTQAHPHWLHLGHYFYTGKHISYSATNSLDEQIIWLKRQQPDYMLAISSHLEHLALADPVGRGIKPLKGVLAISQQLTTDMRSRVEHAFGVEVNINYGLNEVGLVASRCPEGGRYHVHAEHCLVEIVDSEGRACAPGETGHLLVTSLNNYAMPLFRYDTGDIAEVASGPCPCGRLLPSFAGIRGRYRRIALLPDGVWNYWVSFNMALHHMDDDLMKPLRKYQMHHKHDGSFDLRLVTSSPLDPEFNNTIIRYWNGEGPQEANLKKPTPTLNILIVDDIQVGKSNKFESFISDSIPELRNTDNVR